MMRMKEEYGMRATKMGFGMTKKTVMKKILISIFLGCVALSISAQGPAPDTVISGVSFREDLRKAVNWNILKNVAQDNLIDLLQDEAALNTSHRNSISNPHSVTSTQVLPTQSGYFNYVLKSNGTYVYWGLDAGMTGTVGTTLISADSVIERTAGAGFWADGVKLKDYFIELYETSEPSAPSANFGRLYFDVADGKLKLKTSSVIYDLTETGATADSSFVTMTFEKTSTATQTEGRIYYDSDDGWLKFFNGVSEDTLNLPSGEAGSQRTQEEIEDFVGGMLSGNTETGISVDYQDGDGTIDFVIGDLSGTYEVQLNNEAGLYAALSDVSSFYEDGEAIEPGDTATMLANYMLNKAVIVPGDTAAMLANYLERDEGGIGWDSTAVSAELGGISEYALGEGVTVEGVLMEDTSIFLAGDNGLFWNTNVGFYQPTYANIRFKTAGVDVLTFNIAGLLPATPSTYDLGGPSIYFAESYINKMYVGNATAYLDYNAAQLRLTDAAEGTNTLTDIMNWVDSVAQLRIEIDANTAKETNVSTELSTGTVTATTYGITSDGGANDVVLPEATTSAAGLLGADKWDEIVANTAKVTNATHTGDVTGSEELTIAAGAVDIAMLSATGTPSSSTYLRGDNTWGTPAGGGPGEDSLVIDSLAHVLTDSITFPFGIGAMTDADTIVMVNGAYMGGWYNEQDSCVALKAIYEAHGVGTSAGFLIAYGDSIDDPSPVTILSATATTTRTSTTTFTTKVVPRDKKIFCKINGSPAAGAKPTFVEVDLEIAKSRQAQ